jgi:hypothetical protein
MTSSLGRASVENSDLGFSSSYFVALNKLSFLKVRLISQWLASIWFSGSEWK